MKRLILVAALLPLAASSANAAGPDPVPPPVPATVEPAAVPFSKIGWDSATSRFTFEGKPFTGTTTEYHKNGKLKLRYHLKDGVYHGLVEEWYDNGRQTTKTNYEKGKHEGDNFYWNRDGSLQVHKVWKDDVLISETPGPKKP